MRDVSNTTHNQNVRKNIGQNHQLHKSNGTFILLNSMLWTVVRYRVIL